MMDLGIMELALAFAVACFALGLLMNLWMVCGQLRSGMLRGWGKLVDH